MRIPFRQGIVQYNHPLFVQINFPYINLTASIENPLVLNIASGTSDYIHIEKNNVTRAWGPISVGTDVWLYIDIDRLTAQRTFGITYLEPIVGATPPINPQNDKHWFDTTTNLMKVWNGYTWIVKIRIFACKLQSGSIPISVSMLSPDFSGTQIGSTDSVIAGYILFDTENNPIRSTEGQFTTTENVIRVSSLTSNDVKISSLVIEAQALANIPAFTIVEFSDFGKIIPASAFVTQVKKQYGIIQEGVISGGVVNVSVDGLIENPQWDWTSIGVNSYLYNDNYGFIGPTQTIADQNPVAIVVDVHTIMLVTKTIITTRPPVVATISYAGTTRLSVSPVDSFDPLVVGDNDPRMIDSRHPLSHDHAISDIIDLQSSLDSKLSLSGGTLIGALILSSNPSTNLEATTKQYVDSAIFDLSTGIVLDQITDVVLVTPSINQVLTYNGTNWINAAPVSALASLTDVALNSPLNNQVLTYNGTKWVNVTPVSALASLTDVALNSPLNNQVLTYNGTNWINVTPVSALANLSDVTLTSPSSGQFLSYNGTDWINTPLPTVNSNVGTFGSNSQVGTFTVTEKGLITAASNITIDIDAIAPIQTSNSGKFLTTNGTNTSWASVTIGTVTSIGVSGGTTGLTTSNGPITSSGTITLTGTLAIANGGTGQVTATLGFNALAPTQTSNSGKFLTTDGTNTSWGSVTIGTVTSIGVSGGTTGLTTSGGPITSAGTISLTGTLATTNGGTGLTAIGTGLQALRTNSGATALEWYTPTTGTVTSIDGSGGTTGLTLTGGPITSSGTLTLGGTLAIANGGTGQITATLGFNALAPTQTSNSGKFLTTDGTNTSWGSVTTGTVTSISVSGGTTGLTTSGGPITSAGTITLTGTLTTTNGGTGLTAIGTGNQLLRTNSGATALEWYTPSAGTAGSGSVSSVGVSGGTTGLTTSGGPITDSGTITLTGTLATTNGGTGLTTIGASLQLLRTNDAGSALEWYTPITGTPSSGLIVSAYAQVTGTTPMLVGSFQIPPGTYTSKANIGSSDPAYAATLLIKTGNTLLNTLGGVAGGMAWVNAVTPFTVAVQTNIDIYINNNNSAATAYIRGLVL